MRKALLSLPSKYFFQRSAAIAPVTPASYLFAIPIFSLKKDNLIDFFLWTEKPIFHKSILKIEILYKSIPNCNLISLKSNCSPLKVTIASNCLMSSIKLLIFIGVYILTYLPSNRAKLVMIIFSSPTFLGNPLVYMSK